MSQFKALEIQAQVYSATLGWQPLFQHRSFDVVERAGGTATSADYFATGLKPGARHRFRVAWCREGNGRIGCECWSVWTEAASAQPSTFPAGPIALPAAPIVQEVGLPFHFTTSDPPADPTTGTTGGDGWGPSAIWTAPFAHFISRPLAGGGSETFKVLRRSTSRSPRGRSRSRRRSSGRCAPVVRTSLPRPIRRPTRTVRPQRSTTAPISNRAFTPRRRTSANRRIRMPPGPTTMRRRSPMNRTSASPQLIRRFGYSALDRPSSLRPASTSTG